ncbi:MAG: hypothetical protein IKQ91_03220 [Oscillospiraceae bacterium]|nr:hypothetical protein [Oscillospiraceae bacterium]
MKKKNLCVGWLLCLAAATLTGCGKSAEAKAAQTAIDALPASYSDSADEAIIKANDLYDKLSAEDRADVNAEKLVSLTEEQKKEYLKKADQVNKEIKNLSLKADTAVSLKNSAKSINSIASDIQDLPARAQYAVEYDDLLKKIKKCEEEAEKTNNTMVSDTLYEIAAFNALEEWGNANRIEDDSTAYLKMCDVVSNLKKIQLYDTSKAVNAAQEMANIHQQMIEIRQKINAGTVDVNSYVTVISMLGSIETNSKVLKEELVNIKNKYTDEEGNAAYIAYENAAKEYAKSLTNLLQQYEGSLDNYEKDLKDMIDKVEKIAEQN